MSRNQRQKLKGRKNQNDEGNIESVESRVLNVNIDTINKRKIKFYSIICSSIVGYIFSLAIFLGMVVIRWDPLSFLGPPSNITLLLMGSSAILYLICIPIDKYNKEFWIKIFFPIQIIFSIGIAIFVFTLNIIGVFMMFVFLLPAVVVSIICLAFNGYYHDVFNRGRYNAITVVFVFGYVALGSLFSFLSKNLNIGAGLLFYSISGIFNGLISLSLIRNKYIEAIYIPHKSKLMKTKLFYKAKKYIMVLFLYKICLGMLLRFVLYLPKDFLSFDFIWLIIASIAVVVAPILGVLTDKIGRKNIFNLSCALLALIFGIFAFTNQGVNGNYSYTIAIIAFILVAITYPAMLVSEYSIFHDFSNQDIRLKLIADGLFTHVGGIFVGILVGLFFENPDISYFFLATNLMTIGLFITSNAVEPLPNKEERLWKESIRHLYIYHTDSGLGICDFSFKVEEKVDEELVTGGLTGISSLISEMTKRDGKLTAIQQENANILFKASKYITAALISDLNLQILHQKLDALVKDFEDFFSIYLEKFNGDVSKFAPAQSLVARHFIPPTTAGNPENL
ncbi:MAG: MFS transporter [Promethearchaeota archaeon]